MCQFIRGAITAAVGGTVLTERTQVLYRMISSMNRQNCGFFLTFLGIAHVTVLTVSTNALAEEEWPSVGGNSDAWHYSPLAQINDKNVGRLGLAWWVAVPSHEGLVGNPLVADGVVFESGPMGRVYANDARSGGQLWTFSPEPRFDRPLSHA